MNIYKNEVLSEERQLMKWVAGGNFPGGVPGGVWWVGFFPGGGGSFVELSDFRVVYIEYISQKPYC